MKGAARHAARLKRLASNVRREAGKAVYAAADMHIAEASHLITAGAVSGKNHVPSLAGEAPNEDTGTLRTSGHVERVDELTARTVFDAPYAASLEFGTSTMAERPFARPALKKVRPAMVKLLKEAARRANRK